MPGMTRPALASVMLTITGPGGALSLFAVVVAAAGVVVFPLRRGAHVSEEDNDSEPAGSLITALRAAPGAAPALGMLVAEYAVLGALDLLEVVLAAQVLRVGAHGAGFLGAACGAGGLVGAGAALALVGRHRLARPLLLAGAGWGAAFVVLGAGPPLAAALSLLAVAGLARTILDVGGRTSLHRAVPPPLHGRVFGMLEGLEMLGMAVGSVAVPLLIAVVGASGSVIVVGCLLIVVPVLTTPALHAIERAGPPLDIELGVVRSCGLFGMLGPPVLEDIARALTRIDTPTGQEIVREGSPFLEAVTGSRQAHRAARDLVEERLAVP
jgi:hypothetical protein